jgi:hypothetical protein
MRSTRWLAALVLTAVAGCAPAAAALSPPAAAPDATHWRCTTSAPTGNCGPYFDRAITKSDGYNTYVGNNKWGCGPADTCGRQTVQADSPGHWQVTSDQAAGNTAVLTYPDVQQVFTNVTGNDPPIDRFHILFSRFAEAMHARAGTDAEAAYDIWLSNTRGPDEIMIWVDNRGRGNGGATRIGRATIFGQRFTVYEYGHGEIIFSLNRNEQAGIVHILTILGWLQQHGYVARRAAIGQVDFGWEICSTGGRPETFSVSAYTLRSR